MALRHLWALVLGMPIRRTVVFATQAGRLVSALGRDNFRNGLALIARSDVVLQGTIPLLGTMSKIATVELSLVLLELLEDIEETWGIIAMWTVPTAVFATMILESASASRDSTEIIVD